MNEVATDKARLSYVIGRILVSRPLFRSHLECLLPDDCGRLIATLYRAKLTAEPGKPTSCRPSNHHKTASP